MKLYLCGISQFSDLKGQEYLPFQRQMRIKRYLRKEDKARCLVSGLMLNYVFGREHAKNLYYGSNGKPYIHGNTYFNISHSGEYVALAVCSDEVGVDIEKVTPYSTAVAEKCFTPDEIKWLEQQNNMRAFYSLWTGKESVMKATGLGFSLTPENFCILPVSSKPHTINGNIWYLQWHSIKDHEICIADKHGNTAQIIYITRSMLL